MKTGKEQLFEITVPQAKSIVNNGSFIDNDLLMFDKFEDVPIPSEPCRIRCLLVALCMEGSAQYSVDTKERMVKKNDVIIINDGQVVGDYMLSRDCRGIAIMASNNYFSEIIKEVHEVSSLFLFANTHPVFNLKPEKANTFLEYFQLIRQKADDASHHFRKQLVTALLKAMLYDISNEIYQLQQTRDPVKTRAEAIFTEFINLVKKNFRYERRVSWYGEQLCITPKYLSETIKSVSKRTPNEWIDNYVTLEIRVLLKNSSMSIKEIAQELHFPNQSFLGKYFKEHVGMSPSKYRKTF
ncbi:MAG: AraC family transcriptional regulator [Prevotella sp.]|nr:AraC family transcriptional regulator [Prevotella sp.]